MGTAMQARSLALEPALTGLTSTLDVLPVPALIAGSDGFVHFANSAVAALTGHTAAEIVGESLHTAFPVWPAQDLLRHVLSVTSSGQPWKGVVHSQKLGRLPLQWDVTVSPVVSGNSPGQLFLVIAHQGTGQEAVPRTATRIDDAIFSLIQYSFDHSVQELLRHAVDQVCSLTGSKIGLYHFVQDDQETLSLQAWSTATSILFCGADPDGLRFDLAAAGVWADAVRNRRAVIHNDYLSIPERKGLPAGHAPILRELVAPVLSGDRIVALLGIGNKPDDYCESDVEITTRFAELAWALTERKFAEDKLRSRQEQYRNLFDMGSDPIFLVDIESGQILEANQAASELYGFRHDTLVGRKCAELSAEPERSIALAAESQRNPNQVIRVPVCYHRKEDGTVFPVELSARSFELNRRTVLFVSARDVTTRLRSEMVLREREEHHRTLLHASLDGFWLVDSEGSIIEVNETYCRMSGYSAAELLRMGIADLEAVESPAAIAEHISRTRLEGEARFQSRHRRKDDTIFDVEVSVQYRGFEGGRFVCFLRDITEQLRAEVALRESHDLLSNLARLVPGVVYQYRLYPDGRSAFPYSSSGMNDIYEVTPEQVRSDATPVFGRLHPDDLEAVTGAIFHSARTLETFYCEFRVVLPRQGLRWRWSQAHPERTADGGTLWHGIISDITERKLAEADKEKLTSQLVQAQKMESVGRLAGGVAHDFNNLLTVINGYSGFLVSRLAPEDPLRHYAESIGKAGERAASLTRQLLAFSRKQVIQPVELDLNLAVAEAVPLLRRLIGENIELITRLDSNLGATIADPGQIAQVILNLAVNARDAMSDGGKVTITSTNVDLSDVDARGHSDASPGSFVSLTVTDTGHGMDESTRLRVFEPFFTTKERGKGTGLGLSTVYGIIRQSNGWVDVWSQPGVGTAIRVYLPRVPKGPQLVHATSTAKSGLGTETILLVEDQDAVRSYARAVLADSGYHVIEADCAEAAVDISVRRQTAIHLLVTDVVLPGMNGRALATHLLAARPGLRVIFISGYSADAISQSGVLAAGAAFLPKPFSPDALTAKVREILDQ